MTAEQLAGVARTVLATVGGILVSKGYVDNATMTAVVGAVVTLGTAGWSVYAKRAKKAAA